MFKKPALPGVSKKQHRKKLPEEKALVKMLREKSRQTAIAGLLKEEPDVGPIEEDIEGVLDLLIKQLYKDGTIDRMLDEYLQKKIEDQRKGPSSAPKKS